MNLTVEARVYRCEEKCEKCTFEQPFICLKCGNGVMQIDEECDDFNSENGDGCSDKCKIERYWVCNQNPLVGYSECNTVCGDGYRLPNEICDDGNTNNNDGCLDTCQV